MKVILMKKNLCNKSLGTSYEKQLCEYLKSKGYWCFLTPYNPNGQPCDVIAIKRNKAFLMDAKHISTHIFSFSNVRPNQASCFEYANTVAEIRQTGFAIYSGVTKDWRWLSFETLQALQKYKNASIAVEYLPTLEKIICD